MVEDVHSTQTVVSQACQVRVVESPYWPVPQLATQVDPFKKYPEFHAVQFVVRVFQDEHPVEQGFHIDPDTNEFVGQVLTHAPLYRKYVADQVVQVVLSVHTFQLAPHSLHVLPVVSPYFPVPHEVVQVPPIKKFGDEHPVQLVAETSHKVQGDVQGLQFKTSFT